MEFPIITKDEKIFQIEVDKRIYCVQAINAACYRFTDQCYIHQMVSSKNNDIILVTIEAKEGHSIKESFAKQFCNELIDQQVRVTTENQYGHIRDLIVEEAFKPVNK